LNAAKRTPGSDEGAPHDIPGVGIERPVDAALLAEAHHAADEVGAGAAEIVIGSGGRWTVAAPHGTVASDCPDVVTAERLCPLHDAGSEVQSEGGVEVSVRWGALAGLSGVGHRRRLADFYFLGNGVVVADAHVQKTALLIDCGRLPDGIPA